MAAECLHLGWDVSEDLEVAGGCVHKVGDEVRRQSLRDAIRPQLLFVSINGPDGLPEDACLVVGQHPIIPQHSPKPQVMVANPLPQHIVPDGPVQRI